MFKHTKRLADSIKENIQSLRSRERILSIGEKRLQKLTKALEEKEQALREKEAALKERNRAIRARELAFRERDKAILDRDEAIKDTFIDSLTGCYNRNYFDKIMAENYNADLNHNKVGLIFIDINGLKAINDSRGHDAGDKLIRDTADFLRENFRKNYDTVIRLGGDEFVVVCYNYHETTVFESGLTEKVSKCRKESELDFAFGVAVFDKFIDASLEDTRNRADKLMYECKVAEKTRE